METLKNEIKKTLEVWRNKDIWKRRYKNLCHLVGCILLLGIVVIPFFLLENVAYIIRYIVGASIVFISFSVLKIRLKNVRSFLGWSIVACVMIVAVPMPTRCNVENLAYYDGNPGILPPGVDRPFGSPTRHEITHNCYTPNRVEFWENPQWSFEFHWIFSKRLDLFSGNFPDYTIIHLSYPVNYRE